jgi:hypothetical protein
MNYSFKEEIGRIGETLVKEFHGDSFILSEDRYDSKKDGTFNGMTSEIKTMTRVIKGNEYWLEANQYTKVTNVDLLFIVDIPLFEEEGCTIYLCPNNSKLKIEKRFRTGQNLPMVIIPAKKLYQLTNIKNDDRIKRLVELSDSLSPFRRDLKSKKEVMYDK